MDNYSKNTPLIELRNITVSYPERGIILDNISFSIYKGDRIGIYGANGSGKTTLLYTMVGLIKHEKGEIKIFGEKMMSEKDFFKVRKKIGFLFQDSDDQLFSPTVEEDIAFGPLNLRLPREEIERKVENTIKLLGIENLRYRFSQTLSYGEKRIVAIATILSMEPEIYLLDEPTTGLDRKSRGKIEKFLLEKEITYCIVSHEISFLKKACQRLFLLENGKISPFVFNKEEIEFI
ncbi:MAG: energy-coupling factor ABC transporter ATP-binding protein [bacterium]|nr:energy-coupling factor ABC transporter ATP-binding protein [bacterium]MDW8163270.1 energy-coupling factor ABC transporter ATP-binding protein [Candidatus Omnitrophota bacterium]